MKDRPELQKVLTRITNGEIDALVCWQKSWLVRDMAEEVILNKTIAVDAGCKVLFAFSELPMDGTSMNQLIGVIKGWQNQQEEEALSERIKGH